MITADTYVRARIDTVTKDRATEALAAMGLSVSDAIRLLMLRIADERRMPFEVKAANATSAFAASSTIVTQENGAILSYSFPGGTGVLGPGGITVTSGCPWRQWL
jgi:addiction module RelB/DinJ family antitoxin